MSAFMNLLFTASTYIFLVVVSPVEDVVVKLQVDVDVVAVEVDVEITTSVIKLSTVTVLKYSTNSVLIFIHIFVQISTMIDK